MHTAVTTLLLLAYLGLLTGPLVVYRGLSTDRRPLVMKGLAIIPVFVVVIIFLSLFRGVLGASSETDNRVPSQSTRTPGSDESMDFSL